MRLRAPPPRLRSLTAAPPGRACAVGSTAPAGPGRRRGRESPGGEGGAAGAGLGTPRGRGRSQGRAHLSGGRGRRGLGLLPRDPEPAEGGGAIPWPPPRSGTSRSPLRSSVVLPHSAGRVFRFQKPCGWASDALGTSCANSHRCWAPGRSGRPPASHLAQVCWAEPSGAHPSSSCAGRGGGAGRDCTCRKIWSVLALAEEGFTGLLNNPIPSNLKSEAKKAAKILREFTEITSRNGPDKIIPAHVIAKAKGLAILSVVKAGFLVTARGGSGIVLARRPDGSWSAPSAIGIAGLGGGFEIGIEVSDLVIILNYDRAVEAFAKGGNLTLGGNLTVAVGPLGRNLEGNLALRSSAAVFTYCKSRGLFAGISLEGSCLIERKETNRKFYCQDIRAYDILFGELPRPAQAEDLYEILDTFTEKYESAGQRANARRDARQQHKASAKDLPPTPASRPQRSSAPGQLDPDSQSSRNGYKLYPELSSYQERVGNLTQPIEVTALYSFEGQQPGDLNFQAGDRITVTSKTDSQFDWWEGKLRGQTGIFPANYVTMN